MLRPHESEAMERYPVSTVVNKPQNDTPDGMAPIDLTLSSGCDVVSP
ncbi:MAG: hypothetical protein ACHWZW_16515 [Spirulina sp.]